MRRANCVNVDALPCYCGDSGADCFQGAANGACRQVMEAALETQVPVEIATRFTDPNYGGGVANLRLASDAQYCKPECLP
jgi:hypothetical protein